MKKYKLSFICFALMGFFITEEAFSASEVSSGKTMSTSKSTLSVDQIKMAAESGDADAQYALGYMYYYGKGGASKDLALAKTWIGKSAAQKQPQAVKALALMSAQQGQKPSSDQQVATNANMRNEMKEVREETVAQNKPEERMEKTKPLVKNNENMTLVDMRNKQMETEATTSEPVSASESSNPAGTYTLQLLGSSNREQISKLVRDHHLTNKAKIYRTTFKNKDWFVLLYGQFPSKNEAKQEAKRLENELAVKPWIKPYASVKQFKMTSL